MRHNENGTIPFSIEKHVLVDFARACVIEENWRRGLKLLTTTTSPPLTLDQAVSVLTGKETVEPCGEGRFELAPQAPDCPKLTRFLHTAQWQNAGILERNGEFYQPYAVIGSFSRSDISATISQWEMREEWGSVSSFRKACAMPYLRNPLSDFVYFEFGQPPVLFQRVQGPAFWFETFNDPKAAFAAYKVHRASSLEHFGGTFDANSSTDSNGFEFYFKAVVKGLVTLSFDDDLSDADMEVLETVSKMRELLDEQIENLSDEQEFSKEGYLIDAQYLTEKYEKGTSLYCLNVKINRQAAVQGGFLQLKTAEGSTTYNVARAPFLRWAARLTVGDSRAVTPPWQNVAQSGWKMPGDDRNHTDWWASTGTSFEDAYDHSHPLNLAAMKYVHRLNYSGTTGCLKLSGSGKVVGIVEMPKPGEPVSAGAIVVVPHAGPEYELALMAACKAGSGAVIAGAGGKLAHLAIVAREAGVRLAVVEDAMSVFTPGDLVSLDLDTQTFSKCNEELAVD